MPKSTWKLAEDQKAELIRLLIKGWRPARIRDSFLRRGWPELALRTIQEYGQRKEVVTARQQIIELASKSGMADTIARIDRIERRLQVFNHEFEGTTADPYDPEEPTVGPPVFVPSAERRAIFESEIHGFQELDRILRPPASRSTVRDKDGKIVGTTDTQHEAPAQAYLSPVSYAAAYNDYCERLIEAEEARRQRLLETGETDGSNSQ